MQCRVLPKGTGVSGTVIIGGGVIGLSIAWELQRRGEKVLVLDARTAGAAASAANAGYIAGAMAGPVPTPGLVQQSLKWMLNPESPLYIKPRLSPQFLRWLIRFWRACNTSAYEAGLAATTALRDSAPGLLDKWVEDGIEFEMHQNGRIFAYSNQAAIESDLRSFEKSPYKQPNPLYRDDLWSYEPALSEEIIGGYLVEEDRTVQPISLVNGLVAKLEAAGVEIRNGSPVVDIETQRGRAIAVRTPSDRIEADHIVIAAGAWAGQIAKMAGVQLPIEAGKGYGLDFEPSPVKPKRSISLKDAQIAVSPFNNGLRLGGTMELSGINDVMAHRRIAAIEKGGKRFLRDFPETMKPTNVRSGMRPMAPDGLPIIGMVPGFGNLSVATGHSMLGVTLAPATAVLMAELISDGTVSDILKPFTVDRFKGLI